MKWFRENAPGILSIAAIATLCWLVYSSLATRLDHIERDVAWIRGYLSKSGELTYAGKGISPAKTPNPATR